MSFSGSFNTYNIKLLELFTAFSVGVALLLLVFVDDDFPVAPAYGNNIQELE